MDTVYKIRLWQGSGCSSGKSTLRGTERNTEFLLLSPFGGVTCKVKHRFLHILGKCSITQLFLISSFIPQNKKSKELRRWVSG